MWALPSCVYYNTFYNAKTKYEQADLQRLESEAEPENRVLTNAYFDYYLYVIRKASSILELHPDSKWVDDSLLMIGKSYYWRGEHRDALQKFDELLGNFPESELRTETLYWKAIAFWGKDKISSSRELLEQIGQLGLGQLAQNLLGPFVRAAAARLQRGGVKYTDAVFVKQTIQQIIAGQRWVQ